VNESSYVDGCAPSLAWQRLANPVAVLPVGSFEQHGPHLPLATDTLKAEFFARLLAEDLDVALLPALPIGQSYEHEGFRGGVSFRPETFMAIFRDIADELERQHFTRLIVLNGHGGNYALPTVVRDINRAERPLRIVLLNYWEYDRSEEGQRLRVGEVHAGAWETSIMLAQFPQFVGDCGAVIPEVAIESARQNDLNHLGLGHLRPNGVWGDPRGASAEAGHAITASIRENLAAAARERIEWFDKNATYAAQPPAILRPMTERDLVAGERLSRAVDWNQRIEDWRLFYAVNHGGCFVAQEQGKVVGTVATLTYGTEVGWVAMLIVDPAHRRRGIAGRLLAQAEAACAGCRVVKLDATPAGQKVYEQVGFRPEFPLVRMTTPCMPVITLPQGDRVRAMTEADIEAVAATDEEAFGAPRRELIDALFCMAPEYAFVAEAASGDVAGYALGRHGHHFELAGPIIARDGVTARALASRLFAALEGRTAGIDAPARAGAWIEWLRSLGLSPQRPFMRMFKGGDAGSGDVGRIFASAGPELG